MKYPVSGAVTDALITATRSFNLLGATISPGRVLWLKKVWIFAPTGPASCVIGDVANAVTGMSMATGAATGPYTRIGFGVTASGHATLDLPDPGMKFTGYCTIAMCVTGGGLTMAGGEGYET